MPRKSKTPAPAQTTDSENSMTITVDPTATDSVMVPENPDEPGTDEPGTDESSTDEPGTDESDTDEPSTGEPGTGEPDDDLAAFAQTAEVTSFDKSSRKRTRKPNPFDALVTRSRTDNVALAVTVPPREDQNARVKRVEASLRNAAIFTGNGIRIQTANLEDGSVSVRFQATEKRAYKARKNDAAESVESTEDAAESVESAE